jgi:hypothetical protein
MAGALVAHMLSATVLRRLVGALLLGTGVVFIGRFMQQLGW